MGDELSLTSAGNRDAAGLSWLWQSLSTKLLSAESYNVDLWETCVVQEEGTTECYEYDSVLRLSRDIMLARILVCLSDTLGPLGHHYHHPRTKACEELSGGRGAGG